MRDAAPIATRASLLSRVKNWNDHESWRCFFDIYWKLIHGQAIKAGLTDVEAQEVVQETIIAIAHRIKTFKYDRQNGSFKGWLYRLTQWRIADQLRKRQHGVPVEYASFETEFDQSILTSELVSPDGQAAWDAEWQTMMVNAAMENLRKKIRPKHFQIFHCLVQQRKPVRQVANVLKTNVGYVSLVKFRVMSQLRKEIARLEREHV
jgi:RNA polymerase sigma-70 factor (ECF subfamily)